MASRPSGKMLKPLPSDPAHHQDSALAPIAAEARIVLQRGPRHRIVVLTHAEEPAEAQNGVGDLAAYLVDHDPFEFADFLIIGSVYRRAFDLVAGDQGDGFFRLKNCCCCHRSSFHCVEFGTPAPKSNASRISAERG